MLVNERGVIRVNTFHDERGALTVFQDQIPFKVERIFWIYDSDGKIRGGHRHVKTRQALICLRGAVSIFIQNKIKKETIRLDRPDQALIIEPEDWHTMEFLNDAILLVLASTKFDIADYIQDEY
jgi:dTDP-4-dehydrorhamnose 3,5-epimerase-like enzyme